MIDACPTIHSLLHYTKYLVDANCELHGSFLVLLYVFPNRGLWTASSRHTIPTSLALDLLVAIAVSTLFVPSPVQGLPLRDTPCTYLLLHQLAVSPLNRAAIVVQLQ